MKKLECIIRREKLDPTLESLRLAGVPGVTVTMVEGFGRQRIYAGPLLKPKVKLEIYLENDEVDGIVKILIESVREGKLGDGKIAVLEVRDLIRIRTGEDKENALY